MLICAGKGPTCVFFNKTSKSQTCPNIIQNDLSKSSVSYVIPLEICYLLEISHPAQEKLQLAAATIFWGKIPPQNSQMTINGKSVVVGR